MLQAVKKQLKEIRAILIGFLQGSYSLLARDVELEKGSTLVIAPYPEGATRLPR